LAYAQAGKPFATTGTALVRLTCGEAQCYANLGDSRAANHALNAAENIRDRVNSNDAFSGLFAFSRAKQSYYAGSSRIWLDRPEDARRARDEARTALTLWAQGDPEDRSLDDEALAHLYLATALLQLRNLEAALHAIAPVLRLPEERRISWISKRLNRFAGRR
jgi:tetratricopeptide (TPR) repeat protein